jgi:hypothetical protein
VAWEGRYSETGDRVDQWREGHWEAVPKAEGLFLEDERNGPWSEWHNNGKKAATGTFLDGEKHGEWTEWWYSGEPWRTVIYDKGRPQDTAQQLCEERGGQVAHRLRAAAGGM